MKAYGVAPAGSYLGELIAAPTDLHYPSPITAVTFDAVKDVVWAGTESGRIYNLMTSHSLSPYAFWQAHSSPVLELLPLQGAALSSPGSGLGLKGCCLSVSAEKLVVNALGGAPRLTYMDEDGDLSCVCLDPSSASGPYPRALLGHAHSASITCLDLASNKVTAQVDLALPDGDTPAILRAPVSASGPHGGGGRSVVLMATAGGRIALMDPRAGYKLESTTLAHAGGIELMACQGNTAVSCGYSLRGGVPVAEPYMKVFELRGGLRLLATLPTGGGQLPSALAFHPRVPSMLAMAMPSGAFCLVDVSASRMLQAYQVETEGDALTSLAVAPSGESYVLGGSGGYLHLWANPATLAPPPPPPSALPPHYHHPHHDLPVPRVHLTPGSGSGADDSASTAVSLLPVGPPPPAVQLMENDSFAKPLPPMAPAVQGGGASLASDWTGPGGSEVVVSVGLPPKVIDPMLKKDVKKVDFIAHIPNPLYSRGKPRGEATRALAELRNRRVYMGPYQGGGANAGGGAGGHGSGGYMGMGGGYGAGSGYGAGGYGGFGGSSYLDPQEIKAERQRRRQAQGGIVLPLRYQHVEINRQSRRSKWEEFDFSYYNQTSLTGLENDMANAYCNALLQALYFIPAFRTAALRHPPEPNQEFCLACEVAFLFTMLRRAQGSGTPCQATNLLRALRSVREAAALGLLDPIFPSSAGGTGGSGAGGTGGLDTSGAGGSGSSGAGGSGGAASGVVAETALSRRVAALSRFLLEQMHREDSGKPTTTTTPSGQTVQAPPPPPPPPGSGKAANAKDTSSAKGGAAAAATAGANKSGGGAAAAAGTSSGGHSHGNSGEAGALAGVLERVLALSFRSRMQCLQGAPDSRERDGRAFQVDLQYPVSREKAARQAAAAKEQGLARLPGAIQQGLIGASGSADATSSPRAGAGSTSTGANASGSSADASGTAGAGGSGSPCFAALLAASLENVSVTRAWFDESRGYQVVRQSRIPTSLPEVLTVNCSINEQDDLAWWRDSTAANTAQQQQPDTPTSSTSTASSATATGAAGSGSGGVSECQQGKLALALRVLSHPGQWRVEVVQGDSAQELWRTAPDVPEGATMAVYELTAAICQVRDADEVDLKAEGPGGAAAAREYQGHLVAHVKVPQEYWTEASAPPPRPTSLPPGSLADLAAQQEAAKAAQEAATVAAAQQAAAATTAAAAKQQAASAGANGTGASAAAPAVATTCAVALGLPDDLDDVFSSLGVADSEPASDPALGASAAAGNGNGTTAVVAAAADAAAPVTNRRAARTSSGGRAGANSTKSQVTVMATAAISAATGAAAGGSGSGSVMSLHPEWVVLNDFCVSPCPAHEVLSTFGLQKLPALVYYTQVPRPEPPAPAPAPQRQASGKGRKGQQQQQAGGAAGSKGQQQQQALAAVASPPPLYAPCMSLEEFRRLCCSPPLQGNSALLAPYRFRPLDVQRCPPRPGLLLAIDAEFVALAPPVVAVQQGDSSSAAASATADQSRLSLARVAVVLGDGPGSGSVIIDDHVRAVEPVYDYLTRYSGIHPGDLDPTASRHYLTTLKATYLKLRYLLDCGCVFVGHDLRKDWRLLNVIVPPYQVIDTSELLRLRNQRKLSLRYLASWLLGTHIQGGGLTGGHDAIEDARAALRLYQEYLKLRAQGGEAAVEAKLSDMYAWGKQYGWEPVVLKGGKPVPPTAAGSQHQQPNSPHHHHYHHHAMGMAMSPMAMGHHPTMGAMPMGMMGPPPHGRAMGMHHGHHHHMGGQGYGGGGGGGMVMMMGGGGGMMPQPHSPMRGGPPHYM